jgi:hypothetical protein
MCRYIAPELTFTAEGLASYQDNCDQSLDVYAFGVILSEVASQKFT